MDVMTRESLEPLLEPGRGPCVSLYMPTHRAGSEQDPILARNLLRSARHILSASGLTVAEVEELLDPVERLFERDSFWGSQSDGLTCFASPEGMRYFRLPCAFSPKVTAGPCFNLLPLLPLIGEEERFYVLALSHNHVRLLQGTPTGIHEVDLKRAPASLEEAMRFHDRDEPLMFHSRVTSGGTWGRIFHGQGVGIDDEKDDFLRYFRQIDRGLHDLLRDEKSPLILASVEYLWPIYRLANTYPHLLNEGIPGSPDRTADRELDAQARAIVHPRRESAKRRAVELYHQLAGTGRTVTDLKEVLTAAEAGRLEMLFVAGAERRDDEERMNAAVIGTLSHGGIIYELAAPSMPAGCSMAGIYWLPLDKHHKRRKQEVTA